MCEVATEHAQARHYQVVPEQGKNRRDDKAQQMLGTASGISCSCGQEGHLRRGGVVRRGSVVRLGGLLHAADCVIRHMLLHRCGRQRKLHCCEVWLLLGCC